jgi:hypothetical protein
MDTHSRFTARVLRPKGQGADAWAFVLVPAEASAKLPRRGRTTVLGSINGRRFSALLEPDGQKSHWLRIDRPLLEAAGAAVGDVAEIEIEAAPTEPEPGVPPDLRAALERCDDAGRTWAATTTIARVDWIHWITSARQASTRAKRIRDACDMLASGKSRVCCFDPSGFYSKAFKAPTAED